MPPSRERASASPALHGWRQRNGKWALALGVAGLVVVLVCIAMLRNSAVYADAVERARLHPQVAARLGTPIEPGFIPLGDIGMSMDGSGSAALRIPLRGSRGEAYLVAVAERRSGVWRYESLTLDDDDAFPLAAPGTSIGEPPAPQ